MALSAAPTFGNDVRILDGDTIKIGETTYRIFGIDAPEAGQTCARGSGRNWNCGTEAIHALERLVSAGPVNCDGQGLDDYGRTLAICHVGEIDIGAQMVAQGMAWAFRRYSPIYNEIEDQARARDVGIWQAETEPAWELRARRWEAAEQEAPDGCPIKGNISRDGERIYHTPWSHWYSRTKINEAAGERWFCDELEALEAGWRAPLWGG
ncbi:thermonuclease family protein [Arsenicitalea aurantiaca]|uniref:Thermonuclease family protein n=2 Tax=Arsenicitalea aurantiaca TaxID=1783274 RepID=A0A433XM60_9HYPH|nr:thermonuclease family protein [Arsenicitalea aurantiaca]RUT35176.1 thermonuclease family protein [Arsenicitalea aurantiaca]